MSVLCNYALLVWTLLAKNEINIFSLYIYTYQSPILLPWVGGHDLIACADSLD